MFLEIFCLGSLATLLFSAGKATSDTLGRRVKRMASVAEDDNDDSEIDIEDQVRNIFDETKRCHVLKAYKDRMGKYHAILKNLYGMGAYVHADTIEELNEEIDKEYIELAKRR